MAWGAIIASQPDILLFIGDNIYADTENMRVMREEYARHIEVHLKSLQQAGRELVHQ